jgi:Fic family protein
LDREGKLTSTKWAKIGKCPHDTALRDLPYLIDKDILVKDAAAGTFASYHFGKSWRHTPPESRAGYSQ